MCVASVIIFLLFMLKDKPTSLAALFNSSQVCFIASFILPIMHISSAYPTICISLWSNVVFLSPVLVYGVTLCFYHLYFPQHTFHYDIEQQWCQAISLFQIISYFK